MIDKVAGAAVQGASEVAKAPKVQSFGKVMQQAPAQSQGSDDQGDDGYFSYVPPQTSSGGTLGGGSAAGPPVAGTHAS